MPDPGIKPRAPALQADSLPSEPPGKTNSISVSYLGICCLGGKGPLEVDVSSTPHILSKSLEVLET